MGPGGGGERGGADCQTVICTAVLHCLATDWLIARHYQGGRESATLVFTFYLHQSPLCLYLPGLSLPTHIVKKVLDVVWCHLLWSWLDWVTPQCSLTGPEWLRPLIWALEGITGLQASPADKVAVTPWPDWLLRDNDKLWARLRLAGLGCCPSGHCWNLSSIISSFLHFGLTMWSSDCTARLLPSSCSSPPSSSPWVRSLGIPSTV